MSTLRNLISTRFQDDTVLFFLYVLLNGVYECNSASFCKVTQVGAMHSIQHFGTKTGPSKPARLSHKSPSAVNYIIFNLALHTC